MKKTILLVFFLKLNGAQDSLLQWKSSLISHYMPGDSIFIINNSVNEITVFNNSYFKIDNELNYFHIGIMINPGKKCKIDLNRIISFDKVTHMRFCTFLDIKNHLKDSNTPLYYHKSAVIRILTGACYNVSEYNGKLYVELSDKL